MRHLLRLVLAATVLAPATFAQTTWYVDDDGSGDGSGTIDDPYTSIQFAIDRPTTLPGDILVVAAGTYVEDIDLAGKPLEILGDETDRPRIEGVGVASAAVTAPAGQPGGTRLADFVVVAAFDGSQRGLLVAGAATLDVERVRFEGGLEPTPGSSGGQVLVETGAVLMLLTCEARTVLDTAVGGAIAVDGGSLTLHGCDLDGGDFGGPFQERGGIVDVADGELIAVDSVFRRGWVEEGGHGAALALTGSTAWIEGSHFVLSEAFQAEAGAIWSSDSALTIHASSFQECNSVEGPGGAILAEGGILNVVTTEFHDCAALDGQGGAVSLDSTVQATFDRCTFIGNSTYGGPWGSGFGGAVYGNSHTEFRRCLFVENVAEGDPVIEEFGRGGAISEAALVECCTFFANAAGTATDPGTGGAVAAGVVSSSIVWGGHFPDAFAPGVIATYSDVQGGWAGEGNLDVDPLFLDLEGGDFGLRTGSPCIDAGSPDKPLDDDGTPADQGAFPYTWTPIGESYCFANANSTGLAAEMTVLGSSILEDDFLRLRATTLPPYQYGYFLAADSAGFVPGVGGGMGNLCLGMPFVRLSTKPWGEVSFSGIEGRFELRTRLLTLPEAFRPAAGETWHFQAWFRDIVGSDFTSNTSDAVELMFE